ncbi:hypothetical protein VH441_08350 [Psychrobacter sp. HD31]|uniref:hypothetical protein n=1 Tax=Psychrobacter sp. HD31 TaxID=3112003 RepID=UPI003DA52CBE
MKDDRPSDPNEKASKKKHRTVTITLRKNQNTSVDKPLIVADVQKVADEEESKTAVLEDVKKTQASVEKKSLTQSEKSQNESNKPLSVIIHANYDKNRAPIDPARSMDDIPEPARRYGKQIDKIYQRKSKKSQQTTTVNLSKWQLIESLELADHIGLLQAGGLLSLPKNFYINNSKQPLLDNLASMKMVDMSDIHKIMVANPNLTRIGLSSVNDKQTSQPNIDDIQNKDYAPDWELILYPERFEEAPGSLSTDIMACSMAVHVLKQCPTRQSINKKVTMTQVCDLIRSYLLSQCKITPSARQKLRHTPVYIGHVVFAAYYLGWQVEQGDDDQLYCNISTRCGLFSRYPILSDYYINGWQ